jgi:hypothetical protein
MKGSMGSVFHRALAVAALACAFQTSLAPAAELPYEQAPVLSAATLLPKDLVAGPYHTLDDTVFSDGLMYMYTIKSKWGDIKVTSTPMLEKYVRELAAVANLEAMKGSKEFADAMKKVAGNVAEGAGNLIRHPVDSLGGAVSGVGAIFGRTKEAMTSHTAGAEEDSKLANLTGYSTLKREYANELGVDVYSRNPVLQQALDDVADAAFYGNITAKMAMMAIPGGAGAAVSVAGNTEALNDALRDLPPLELRKRNREALAAMGVNAELVALLIENSVFTPSEQTWLVDALGTMNGTENRDAFVHQAILTNDADAAFFRMRQARMYADYNRTKPVARFVSVGNAVVAQNQDGGLVFCVPIDALYWTPRMGDFLTAFEAAVPQVAGVKGKEIILGGAVSPMARNKLEALGWHVVSAR